MNIREALVKLNRKNRIQTVKMGSQLYTRDGEIVFCTGISQLETF